MSRAILVAVELSADDRPLAEVAETYAKALGAKLYLVHVLPGEADFVGLPKAGEAKTGGTEGVAVGYAYDRERAAGRARAAHRELQELAARVEAAGVASTALLIEGAAAEKIAAEAARLGAGLIIVGTHRRGALGEWFLGSVSKEVLRRAPCPVLVVPTGG